jgi:ATP-dependent helicase/nuclease subunit A
MHALHQWHDPDDGVGFLEWIHRDDTVFKSINQGGIQLLTIHGAKGAQAPVVILPDLPAPLEKDDPEYWRLLYVAMTRAQDRLYMSARKDTSPWYQVIAKAMNDVPTVRSTDCLGRIQWTHASQSIERHEVFNPVEGSTMTAPVGSIPNWFCPLSQLDDESGTFGELIGCMRDEKMPQKALPPIKKSDAPDHPSEMTLRSYAYRHRGAALHQLLEELPTQSPDLWWGQSVSFLKKQGLGDDHAQRWADQLVRLLQRCDLKPLFFEARAEVEWCSPNELRRMDRVLVRSDDVWIVDFKSDNRQPMPWFDSPYVVQMQRYADGMASVYPKKRIHQGILWLKSGLLQWHPDAQCWGFLN